MDRTCYSLLAARDTRPDTVRVTLWRVDGSDQRVFLMTDDEARRAIGRLVAALAEQLEPRPMGRK